MSKLAAVLALLSTFTLASAAEFNGFLYSKLQNVGTRSEGPGYFLQTFDGRDLAIKKHGMLWQHDRTLDVHLGTKVTIHGDFWGRNMIAYRSVKAYRPRMPKP